MFYNAEPQCGVFIDYQAFEPFTGAVLPTREQVQLVYETYRSRLHVLSWMPPTQAFLQAIQIGQVFPAAQADYAVRSPSIDALRKPLKSKFALYTLGSASRAVMSASIASAP